MQKWEYCGVSLSFVGVLAGVFMFGPDGRQQKVGKPQTEEAIKYLNYLGSLGWEIVGAHEIRTEYETLHWWYLKRPVD